MTSLSAASRMKMEKLISGVIMSLDIDDSVLITHICNVIAKFCVKHDYFTNFCNDSGIHKVSQIIQKMRNSNVSFIEHTKCIGLLNFYLNSSIYNEESVETSESSGQTPTAPVVGASSESNGQTPTSPVVGASSESNGQTPQAMEASDVVTSSNQNQTTNSSINDGIFSGNGLIAITSNEAIIAILKNTIQERM